MRLKATWNWLMMKDFPGLSQYLHPDQMVGTVHSEALGDEANCEVVAFVHYILYFLLMCS